MNPQSRILGVRQKLQIASRWHVEHWRGDALLTERDEDNLVPDEFINNALDVILSGGSQVANWYLALFSDDHTPAPADTYAVPGYTEATGYDEATRPQWMEGGVSGKQITNMASKATFTMDGTNGTIYGCSFVSVDTKGDVAGGGVLGPVTQFTGGPIIGIIDDDVIKIYMTIAGSDV